MSHLSGSLPLDRPDSSHEGMIDPVCPSLFQRSSEANTCTDYLPSGDRNPTASVSLRKLLAVLTDPFPVRLARL